MLDVPVDQVGQRLDALDLLYRPESVGSTAWSNSSVAIRSASTSTSRSARTAATTARSPPGRIVTTCRSSTSTRLRADIERASLAAGHQRVRRWRHADAGRPAGARRRCCASIPPWRRRRGDGRVQPRRRHRRDDAHLRRGRCQPGQHRCAVDGAVGAGRARAHARARQRRSAPWQRCARPASPTFNLDLIYGGAGETLDDWRATLEGALALGPPHVSAYALTVEAGTPLADDPIASSRRRRSGRQVRAGRRSAHRCRVWPTTRSATGRCPATSAATTSCTGSRATTAGSAAPPTATATVAAGGTCARPSGTSPRSRRVRPTEAAGETLDDETRRVEGLQLALRMRDGVPAATSRCRRSRGSGRRPTGSVCD